METRTTESHRQKKVTVAACCSSAFPFCLKVSLAAYTRPQSGLTASSILSKMPQLPLVTGTTWLSPWVLKCWPLTFWLQIQRGVQPQAAFKSWTPTGKVKPGSLLLFFDRKVLFAGLQGSQEEAFSWVTASFTMKSVASSQVPVLYLHKTGGLPLLRCTIIVSIQNCCACAVLVICDDLRWQ